MCWMFFSVGRGRNAGFVPGLFADEDFAFGVHPAVFAESDHVCWGR